MLQPDELIIDNFAGGGGASTGMTLALGRSPDVAINHDAEAVALHAANHPDTLHLCQSVWKADPLEVVEQASARRCHRIGVSYRRLKVGVAWFSPDCKHFSKAKGSKPVEKGIRDLAWVVVHWARELKKRDLQPRIIMLENVEEFRDWGPLVATEDGKLVPCPVSKGLTFKRWVRALKKLGYVVEWREIRAYEHGAPTIRKRLYVIARCDGEPIVWPERSHDKPGGIGHGLGKLPWRTAAECIDWSIPCPSIFTRDRPLAENTLKRIARGVMRYVVNAETPFIVGVGGRMGQSPERPVTVPMQTVTAKGDSALVSPVVVSSAHGGTTGRAPYAWPAAEPLRTMKGSPEFAVIAPITHVGDARVHPIDEPLRTITTAHRGEQALIGVHVTKFRGGATGHAMDEPMATVTANSFVKRPGGAAPLGLVSATLVPRYGERPGQEPRARSVADPMATVTPTQNGASLVAAFLAQHNTGNDGHDVREPVSTIVGKGCTQGFVECALSDSDRAGAERVAAFISKYYGTGDGQALDEPAHTITTKDRLSLVTVNGWPIVDIGMRMLSPRELYRAQGFPETYVIDGPGPNGKPLTKTAQVRMCGNSVCPPVAEALARANAGSLAATPTMVAAE